jgi:hypothetical protein
MTLISTIRKTKKGMNVLAKEQLKRKGLLLPKMERDITEKELNEDEEVEITFIMRTHGSKEK